ncbi:MAG: helix-turn-helix transcriptional regulator [Oscillospiraceae bacterium]
MTLREKLIVSRNKAGLSQMELAERLGVSRQAVSRWESGDTTPTMDKLKALAKIYGVSLDWLCSDAADRRTPRSSKTRSRQAPGRCPRGKGR